MSGSRTGTARGKIILLGEHGVVHGAGGISLSIPLKVTVRIEKRGDTPLPLPSPWVRWFSDLSRRVVGESFLPQESTGDLPQGAGLGSSAGFTVASLRALPVSLTREDLIRYGDEGEKIFHGNPSGIDVRTVVYETPLFFRRFPTLTVEPLKIGRSFYLVLWITPGGRSTKEMVKKVTEELEKRGKEKEIRIAEEIVEEGKKALQRGDLPLLGNALTSFHSWLSRLGASTPLLDSLLSYAKEKGALGGKLTGAGGGGTFLALFPSPVEIPPPPGVIQAYRMEIQGETSTG
jgi:mevalonate kinase